MISVLSLIIKTFHFHVQFTYKIHNTILRLTNLHILVSVSNKYTYLGERRQRGGITKMFYNHNYVFEIFFPDLLRTKKKASNNINRSSNF